MVTQMDKVQLLLDYDKDMLNKLIEARNYVEAAKLELEEKNIHLKGLKSTQESKLTSKELKRDELYVVQAELQNDVEALEQLEAQYNADANMLMEVLKQQEVKRAYIEGDMMWPLPASYQYISSPFGMRLHPILGKRLMHTGIDIPAPGGTSIYAAKGGTVINAAYLGSYGNAVIIDHGGGIHTLYGHSSKLLVSEGDVVNKGDVVALVGSTGRSTGNHLHFEVRENGVYVDPKKYLFNSKE